MAKLLKSRCPECHAPLNIDPGAEYVTCEFCGHKAFLQRANRAAPQRTAETVNFGMIDVDAIQTKARKMMIIIFVAVFIPPLLGGISCAVCAIVGSDMIPR